MRVLFVPYVDGVVSHGLPLIALARLLRGTGDVTAFLVPAKWAPLISALGCDVLDVDHRDFRTEMIAYGRFRPDVVVDDASLTTWAASRVSGLPRVAVVRTGCMRGEVRRSDAPHHSLRLDVAAMPDATFLGLPQPRRLDEWFEGDLQVIPGLPSIEPAPAADAAHAPHVHAGPLVIEDYFVSSARLFDADGAAGKTSAALDVWLAANVNRPLIYLTLGTVAVEGVSDVLREAIRLLVERGLSVLTNVPVDPPPPSDRYFRARYLPMHRACARADVVVHHAGSGTYHYPLIHGKPSVTVSTGCYDREDVALQLQALGVATHLTMRQTDRELPGALAAAVESALALDAAARRQRFEPLQREIAAISAEFHFPDILQRAAALRRRSPRQHGAPASLSRSRHVN